MSLHPTPFSFAEYREILKKYKPVNCDFTEIDNRDSFALIRHDVEFNVERAMKLAEIDSECGVVSSFLFQVRSNAYNLMSSINAARILRIRRLGLKIGLHFHVGELQENDWASLERELLGQASIFELATGITVDRFSYHRPPKWVLENRDDRFAGLINVYGKSYFEYIPHPSDIKYIADSRHRYDYGHPLSDFDFKRFQILLHPDEWSIHGMNEYDNFRALENENLAELERTMQLETPKNFIPRLK